MGTEICRPFKINEQMHRQRFCEVITKMHCNKKSNISFFSFLRFLRGFSYVQKRNRYNKTGQKLAQLDEFFIIANFIVLHKNSVNKLNF